MVDVMNVWERKKKRDSSSCKLQFTASSSSSLSPRSIDTRGTLEQQLLPLHCECISWWLYANSDIRSQGKQLIIDVIFLITQTDSRTPSDYWVDQLYSLFFASHSLDLWFLFSVPPFASLSSTDICLRVSSATSVTSLPTLASHTKKRWLNICRFRFKYSRDNCDDCLSHFT